MGIPGEALDGSFAATDLVGWYNGHPDHRHHRFDLSSEAAAIVGVGNVAMDVARILTQDAELLAKTDAASYAVEALRNSRIRRVYLIGRRGPVQAAFSPKEIEEIGEIERASLTVTNEDLVLDDVSKSGLVDPRVKKNYEYLSTVARRSAGAKDRRIILRFCVSPVALVGSAGHVEAITLERNELIPDGHGGVTARGTGRLETLDGIGLVFRAVGSRGIPIPGVRFDNHAGHIANVDGRVTAANAVVPGEYVVGWAKRGPSGLVGTNRADSIATVQAMLADLKETTASERRVDPSLETTPRLLAAKRVKSVDFTQWKRLDKIELTRGAEHGKVREKFTRVEDMLAALCMTTSSMVTSPRCQATTDKTGRIVQEARANDVMCIDLQSGEPQ
jgi:ferredoxin--NADP+ reductase